MQKIMFNDKYGLTKAVLEGKKTQTRRIIEGHTYMKPMATLCQGKLRVNEIFKSEDISRYAVGETLAIAQSYENIHLTAAAQQHDIILLDQIPENYKEGIEKLIQTARNSKISEVLKRQELSPLETDSEPKEEKTSFQPPRNIYSSNSNAKELSAMYSVEFGLAKTPGWKNKMFVRADLMPHQIRITGIRLERLQDISDADCIKEGIIEDCPGVQYSFPTEIGYCGQYPFATQRAAYAELIDKVSGKGTWNKNPWVFVYNFELVK